MSKSLIVNFHDVEDGVWFEKIILLLKSRYKLVSLGFLEDIYKSKKKLNNF